MIEIKEAVKWSIAFFGAAVLGIVFEAQVITFIFLPFALGLAIAAFLRAIED